MSPVMPLFIDMPQLLNVTCGLRMPGHTSSRCKQLCNLHVHYTTAHDVHTTCLVAYAADASMPPALVNVHVSAHPACLQPLPVGTEDAHLSAGRGGRSLHLGLLSHACAKYWAGGAHWAAAGTRGMRLLPSPRDRKSNLKSQTGLVRLASCRHLHARADAKLSSPGLYTGSRHPAGSPALRLASGALTRSRRRAGSLVCLVASGASQVTNRLVKGLSVWSSGCPAGTLVPCSRGPSIQTERNHQAS